MLLRVRYKNKRDVLFKIIISSLKISFFVDIVIDCCGLSPFGIMDLLLSMSSLMDP
uniref:Uncharacterized protein n=1 Tax=Lepeophtheirus salmonis TaxID=72036 RepID=A0A0K2US65_LEPSM